MLKLTYKKVLNNAQIVLFGDSQTEFIKSSTIYNRSINGSPYFVHYAFAKTFINQLRGKTIIIAFNYHNLSKLYQNRFLNDSLFPGWKEDMINHTHEFNLVNFNRYETSDVFHSKKVFDIKSAYNLFKLLFLKKNLENTNGFVVDSMSISETIYRHWKHPDYITNDSIQQFYLMNLVKLLKHNNCRVILLKMPLTNFYLENVPLSEKQKYLRLVEKLNVDFINLNDSLKISNQYKYFKDYGHLNLVGDSLVVNNLKKYNFINQ